VVLTLLRGERPCRDLDRMEHWAITNSIKLIKETCGISGWSDTRHKYKLGEEWLESSPVGRGLGVLVGSRLHRSQQGALATQRANPIWGASNTAQPVGQKRGLSPSIQRWWGLTLNTVCSSGPHN